MNQVALIYATLVILLVGLSVLVGAWAGSSGRGRHRR